MKKNDEIINILKLIKDLNVPETNSLVEED